MLVGAATTVLMHAAKEKMVDRILEYNKLRWWVRLVRKLELGMLNVWSMEKVESKPICIRVFYHFVHVEPWLRTRSMMDSVKRYHNLGNAHRWTCSHSHFPKKNVKRNTAFSFSSWSSLEVESGSQWLEARKGWGRNKDTLSAPLRSVNQGQYAILHIPAGFRLVIAQSKR